MVAAVERLTADHRERRSDRSCNEHVPWEQGRSELDEPWEESDDAVGPEARTVLLGSLALFVLAILLLRRWTAAAASYR